MFIDIHYIFSRNKKIGSYIIREGSHFLAPNIEDAPSHVCLLIDNKWIVESTLEYGFRVISYKKWLKINEELYKIKSKDQWTMEMIKKHYKPLKNKEYDYWGVIYFGWSVVLMKLFGIQKPVKNKLNSENKYFCTEVIGKMTNTNYEMTAPIELLQILIDQESSINN